MPDYKSMCFKLAAKVADVIEVLIEAQQQGEDDYIESAEEQTEEIVKEKHIN